MQDGFVSEQIKDNISWTVGEWNIIDDTFSHAIGNV